MYNLQIEHHVTDFDGWKKLFDSDPIGREKSGVIKYRIMRSIDDKNLVIIGLDFSDINKAKSTLSALKEMWSKMQGNEVMDTKTRIVEVVDKKEFQKV